MLLLKLVHGIGSWLTGRELPLLEVGFAFPRPDFAEDYPILFPAPVRFGQTNSAITLDAALEDLPVSRNDAEMAAFLRNAPEDGSSPARKTMRYRSGCGAYCCAPTAWPINSRMWRRPLARRRAH